MYTFGQLKAEVRQRIWPGGEADNLVAAHDKMFVDALMELQTWDKCLQQDHTDIIPQCATLYRCGLAVAEAPRGRVMRVSAVDRVDPLTRTESADAAPNYCGEIVYRQIDPRDIARYLTELQHCPGSMGAPVSGPVYEKSPVQLFYFEGDPNGKVLAKDPGQPGWAAACFDTAANVVWWKTDGAEGNRGWH